MGNEEEIMKRYIYFMMMVLLVTSCVPASETEAVGSADDGAVVSVTWLEDFEAAKKEATAKKLPILVNFSGSDWCGWCIKLDNEVFSKKEFKEYAATSLVLFLADFPQSKKQVEEIKKQNSKLAADYGVRGFPTILLLDADGKVLARTGYEKGGAVKYVKHLKGLLNKK